MNFSNLSKILLEFYMSRNISVFEVDCQLYAEKFYDFVDYNIHKPISRDTPASMHKFGTKFIKYKTNNRMTWYIFFDEKDNRFLINHIINNHS